MKIIVKTDIKHEKHYDIYLQSNNPTKVKDTV